jgi:ABC-type uncharacterized transport system substrate-binding protein
VGGGLASYGVNNLDLYRRAAGYVDRVLKGETPPVSLLARTDEVIE